MATTTASQKYNEEEAERLLLEIGPSPAVQRFAESYGSVKTRRAYLQALSRYFRWLKEAKGVEMTPDELLKDNLRCIFDSPATDVISKRKHSDWLSAYVNRHMLDRGLSQGAREVFAAEIRAFYAKNDSGLWGHFSVSKEPAKEPPAPLDPMDIREVLKSLPLNVRLPLLVEWQSSIEIDRVLFLRWKDVFPGLESGISTLQLTFYGRKKHRKQYSPFLGADSIKGLKLWMSIWAENVGRSPDPEDLIFLGKRKSGIPVPMSISWLNRRMRQTALRLFVQGLVKNGNPRSWHTHHLRHSFSTECSHAGVKPEIREYMMGHLGGIAWVYQHPDLHKEDLIVEYRKVEPFLSLDYNEVVAREEKEESSKAMLQLIESLQKRIASLEHQRAA